MTYNRFVDSGRREFPCGSWSRDIAYATRLGVVLIHQHHWKLSAGAIDRYATEFSFVLNGYLHEYIVEYIGYTDSSLKNLSTRFIKKCFRYEI